VGKHCALALALALGFGARQIDRSSAPKWGFFLFWEFHFSFLFGVNSTQQGLNIICFSFLKVLLT